ncbi:hypothetical protein TWF481_010921 [Arthrobotrys musiformis]|uniref:F-box domain-containing protein n=1 Tax=Arthrobotrys musiformis TaxID=47236 RepID=A0AAV9VWS5_9PEZI
MASQVPPELWLKVIAYLPYEDTHLRLRHVNKYLRSLTSGLTIRQLPLTLWERIFEYLDYFTLLDLSAACKSFRGCIRYSKSKAIQAATFREPLLPPTPLPPGTSFTLHPAFKTIRVGDYPARALMSLKRGTLRNTDIDTVEFSIIYVDGKSLMSENITSPPVQLYELSGFGLATSGESRVQPSGDPKPVTLRDVILDMQIVGDVTTVCRSFMGVDRNNVESIGRDAVREFTTLDGQRIVKVVEHGAVVLRLEEVHEVLHTTQTVDHWIDEEEAERNAELLLLSMIGAPRYDEDL